MQNILSLINDFTDHVTVVDWRTTLQQQQIIDIKMKIKIFAFCNTTVQIQIMRHWILIAFHDRTDFKYLIIIYLIERERDMSRSEKYDNNGEGMN